jgi:hypothetical protein
VRWSSAGSRYGLIALACLYCLAFFGYVYPGYAEAGECFFKILYQLDVKNLEN